MGKYDMSGEPPLPTGEYVMSLLKVEEKVGKSDPSSTNISVQMVVSEGEHEGRQMFRTISPKMKGLIRSFFVAVGLHPKDQFQGELDVTEEQLAALTGTPVIVKGKVKQGDRGEQFEISTFLMHETVAKALEAAINAPEQTAAPAPAPAAAKPAPAPASKPATAAKPPLARKSI